MRPAPHSVTVGIFAAILAVLLASALPAYGQALDPLDALRNMTPAQQDALRRAAGGAGGVGALAGGDGGLGDIAEARANEAAAEAMEAQRLRSQVTGEEEPLIPVMKPEDTILVQLALPPTPEQNRALQQQSQTPQAQTSGQNGQQDDQQGNSQRRQVDQEELAADERAKLRSLADLIHSRNPYRLDRNASLELPGFAAIRLGGLTEVQAMQRLAAEPALLKFQVLITRLPLARAGVDNLKRFGYDLFESAPSTFSPLTDVPVPADYVVGPGDELTVQMYGGQSRTLRLTVTREGRINFPDIGPIDVAGQSFNAVRSNIEARVERQIIGMHASVSLGTIRSIRVFVLGEARQPGSYTVSGLATVTTALFASGGVKPIGSLRSIQLKRQGKVLRTLDLYDLLIHGDTSDDAKLMPGDAIFIPPVGSTVSVDGEVKRPAIYELKGESTAVDAIAMAGGPTPEADMGRASLTRLDDQRRRVVERVDLTPGSLGGRIGNGDVLTIARLRPTLDSGVTLQGFVFRPGNFAWRQGLRLSEIVGSVDELKPGADQNYLLIRREMPPDRRITTVSADLNAALAAPGSAADIVLMPRDRITVFDLEPGRERIVKPILEEIRMQSALDRPTAVVRVEGKVKAPGEYPLEEGMRVSDLLRAGGNLQAAAYGGKAELARYRVSEGESRRTELMEINLAAVLSGDASANVPLQPFDYLLIKETPDWTDQEAIKLEGEVRFPGTYPIRRGETMRSVLLRAGGLTDLAFPRGSVFTRKELKEREQQQLDMLAERLQSDLGSLALQAAAANQNGAGAALSAGQSLLAQLQGSKAVGRLVIDLPAVMGTEPGSMRDVVMKDGDRLIVPKQKQEVTVIGEVQSVTSHFYRSELSRDDYVQLSGGLTRKGDKGKTYVVRADGSVVANERSLFRRQFDVAIQPGDTIVVPLNTERIPRLPFWQAVTQIIYNLAVSVAAINSF
ncbi:MAG: SLBB domain-containing protein [Steroidobacteraceae bacterium]